MYFLIDSMKSVLVSLRDLWSFMCRTKTLISSEESILPYTDMSQQKILSSFFFFRIHYKYLYSQILADKIFLPFATSYVAINPHGTLALPRKWKPEEFQQI